MPFHDQQNARLSVAELMAIVHALEYTINNEKKLSNMEMVVSRGAANHMNALLDKALKS